MIDIMFDGGDTMEMPELLEAAIWQYHASWNKSTREYNECLAIADDPMYPFKCTLCPDHDDDGIPHIAEDEVGNVYRVWTDED